MRIAILSETFLPKVDGISNTLCHLLDYLVDKDHKSLLFAPGGSPTSYAATPIIPLPSFRAPYYPELKVIHPWINVNQTIERFGPDIIHMVSPFGFTLSGLQIARRLNVPVVASYHTDVPGFARHWGLGIFSTGLWAYFRWVHNQADMTLVPTRFTQRQIEAQGFERVRIWGRGVDTTRYSPANRSHEWRCRLSNGNPDSPILLYAGRLAPEKKVERLLPIVQSMPQVRLAIVGDGPQRAHLKSVFAGTPTIFTGYLYGQDLAQAYASADIFTFTGDKETFGNVILEAMASGLCVVAPNSGGVVEHILHERTGYLYAVDHPQEFLDAVGGLVHNPEQRLQMGQMAHKYTQQARWEDVMNSLLNHYEEVIHYRRYRLPFPKSKYLAI